MEKRKYYPGLELNPWSSSPFPVSILIELSLLLAAGHSMTMARRRLEIYVVSYRGLPQVDLDLQGKCNHMRKSLNVMFCPIKKHKKLS
jgi:hypothetical protein